MHGVVTVYFVVRLKKKKKKKKKKNSVSRLSYITPAGYFCLISV
jgi:hypothetical protein